MTGLDFENAARISCPSNAIDLTKNKLYSYLKDSGIDWRKYISRKLLPDNAFLFEADKVYEEIKKCVVLCANCHREFHYLQTKNPSYTLKEYLENDI